MAVLCLSDYGDFFSDSFLDDITEYYEKYVPVFCQETDLSLGGSDLVWIRRCISLSCD